MWSMACTRTWPPQQPGDNGSSDADDVHHDRQLKMTMPGTIVVRQVRPLQRAKDAVHPFSVYPDGLPMRRALPLQGRALRAYEFVDNDSAIVVGRWCKACRQRRC